MNIIKKLFLPLILLLIINGARGQFNISNYYNRACKDYYSGNYREAINKLNRILEINPNNLNAYYLRGNCKLELGDYSGANVDYDEMIRLNPYLGEGYRLRGLSKTFLNDYNSALTDIELAIKHEPGNYNHYFSRGNIYFEFNDYEKAIIDYSKVIAFYDKSPILFFRRALCHYNTNNYKAAIDDFSKCIKLNHFEPDYFYYRAQAFMLVNDYENAILDLNNAINLNKNDKSYYFERGRNKYLNSDNSGSLKDLEQAIILDENYAKAHYLKGYIEMDSKNNKQAIQDFTKVLEIEPTFDQALYYRANLYEESKQYNEAIKDYNQAISINDSSSSYFFFRATLKSELNDHFGAIEDYNSAELLDSTNFYIPYYRSISLINTHKFEEAIVDLSKAIEIFPQFAKAYLVRAEIKELYFNKNEAQTDLDSAKYHIAKYEDNIKNNDVDLNHLMDSIYNFDKLGKFNLDFKYPTTDSDKIKQQQIEREQFFDLRPNLIVTITNKSTKQFNSPFYIKSLEEINDSRILNTPYTFSNNLLNLPKDSVVTLLKKSEFIEASKVPKPQLFFYQGLLNSMIQNFNQSLKAYGTAISLDPNFELAYFNRANTRYLMIEYVNSLEDYSQVLTIEGKATTHKEDKPQNIQYDYNDVITDLDKAIEINPTFGFAYYNRANVKCMTKDFTGAIDDYTKSIEVGPQIPQAHFNRGLTLIYLQDKEKGCLDMSKAGELGVEEAYPVIKKYCTADE